MAYFAVGAVAGALTAMGAGGVTSLLGQGTFAAGALGTAAAGVVASSFVSGAVIGAAGGLVGGFTTGFGNALVDGKNIGACFKNGIRDGVIGGITGGLIGGIAGGIDAYMNDRNFWTWELPKGGDQRIWGEMTIKARGLGDGSVSTDGHSWLELRDCDGNVTTYGTWGNQGKQEFLVNFRGDGGTVNAFQTQKITFAQKLRFDNFISKGSNTNWTIFKNCSAFTSKAFNYVTGFNVSAHPFMIPVCTPSWLVNTINH